MSEERKAQVKEIMDSVKANHKLLDDCSGPHDFSKKEDKPFSDYVCSKCGGKISSHDFYWYNKGLEHMEQWKFLEWAAENPEENV